MKTLAIVLLFSGLCFAQDRDHDAARETKAPAKCVETTFFGNVKKGQPFLQPLGDGLTYRLAPYNLPSADGKTPNFIGWTIEVAYLKEKGEMEREFSWVLTPPYRQWNARQLNTSYGKSVEYVLNAGHAVYFPTNILDYAQADRIVQRILWRSSPPETMEAAEVLPKVPAGEAKLTILGKQVSGEQIETLSFKVELKVPTTLKLVPDLNAKAKPAACPISPVVPMLQKMVQ